MLKHDFVPVAIDQWYQRRQKDAEGEFYRKVAGQGPLNDFDQTTQGRYICTPDGILMGYNNNYGPKKIRLLMKLALQKFNRHYIETLKPIEPGVVDRKFEKAPPKDGLIVRVHSRILGGYKENLKADSGVLPYEKRQAYFQQSTGRDNLWFKDTERVELAKWIKDGGEMPTKLAQRVARFHLIDNTRGEPPHWTAKEIKSLSITVDDLGIIKGKVHLVTKDGKRGYQASLYGVAKVDPADESAGDPKESSHLRLHFGSVTGQIRPI